MPYRVGHQRNVIKGFVSRNQVRHMPSKIVFEIRQHFSHETGYTCLSFAHRIPLHSMGQVPSSTEGV